MALELATDSMSNLHRLGECKKESSGDISIRNLLSLWTGMGSIDEVTLKASNGSTCSFVVKTIGSHSHLMDDELALVDHMGYYNEVAFYEQDLSASLWSAGVQLPRPVIVKHTEVGDVVICMTKLPGGKFRPTTDQSMQAVAWL